MRFYHFSVPEVMGLTIRQLFFLGDRMQVYWAEDMLDILSVFSFPHQKEQARAELLARFRGIIDADKLRSDEGRPMDRDGLDRLKGIVRDRASSS